MHDAGISGQIHALYESAAGFVVVVECGDDLRPSDPCAAQVYASFVE
jgi:hypothetical protein